MDLTRVRVVLRERAVLDVLDLSLRFMMSHAAVYARVSALVLAPFLALSIALCQVSGPIVGWGLTLFLAPVASAPFTILASRLIFEEGGSARAASSLGIKKGLQVLVVRTVVLVAAVFGLSGFLVGAFVPLALFMFTTEVLLLEQGRVWPALGRSANIVSRSSGETTMAMIALALTHAVIVFFADIGGRATLGAIFEWQGLSPVWEDGWSVLALLGFWLFVPYIATARFFVYLDARTRSEGWDIQTRFTAIATRPRDEARSAA